MTREEIEKNRQYQQTGAAIDYCRKELSHYDGEALGEITDAFEAGAEWEHKRLVEKAVNWLVMNASNYAISTTGDNDDCIVSLDMVEDFEKAIEE